MDPVEVALIVTGSLLLVAGGLLVRCAIAVVGGVLGAAIGFGASLAVIELTGGSTQDLWWLAGLTALASMIAGVAAFAILRVGAIFVAGAALGGWAFVLLHPLAVETGFPALQTDAFFAFGIPCAAVFVGLAFAFFERHLVALGSSLAGALLIATALPPHLAVPVAALLAVVGFVLQVRSEPGEEEAPARA